MSTLDHAVSEDTRAALLGELAGLLPAAGLLRDAEDLKPYECDALTVFRQMPMAVALPENEAQVIAILKAWSLFVRLAHPEARREAITSRPWLMSSVGRRTEHAGQTTITLTGLHAHFDKARTALMRVSALLQGWGTQAAEQLNPQAVWLRVCEHLKQTLAGIGPPPILRLLENHANGIG